LAPNQVGWKIETVLGWIEDKKIWTLKDMKIADGDIVVDPNDPMIKRLTPYITAAAYANMLGRPVSTTELGSDLSMMVSDQECETLLGQGKAGYRRGEH
jgi:hypothetical protein